MKRYISLYLNMAPETFERMQENVDTKSWDDLAINAHSFKPQAEYMGIEVLRDLMIEIEFNVKSNKFDNLEILFVKASAIQNESAVILHEFINSN